MNKLYYALLSVLVIGLLIFEYPNIEALTQTHVYNTSIKTGWDNNVYVEKFTGLGPIQNITNIAINITATGTGSFTSCTFNCVYLGPINTPSLTGWNGAVYVNRFLNLQVGSHITAVQLNVTATGGGNVRIKIYDASNSSGNARPTTLLSESGSLSVTGTGLQTFSVPDAKVGSSGSVFAGFETDSGTFGMVGSNYSDPPNNECQFVTHTYGVGPSPFGTPTSNCAPNRAGEHEFVTQLITETDVRMKIYQDDGGAGAPNTLLAQSNSLPVTGTGIKNFTIISSIPASGNVWAGFEVNNTNMGLRYANTAATACDSVAHTYGTGPSPFGAAASCTATNPYMQITYQNYTSISLSPSSGPIGTKTIVTGKNFGKNNNTNISIDGNLVATSGVHSSTSFTKSISIYYSGITTGAKTVNATDTSGSPPKSAIATFTVTTPNLFLNSTNGHVQVGLSAKGNGFLNNTSLQLTYDGTALSTNPALPTTNSTGGFKGLNFTVPDSVSGSHTVKVRDGDNNNATISYNVTSSINIFPSAGVVGDLVIGNAKGFLGTHAITIKFDGTTVQSGTTNSAGSFTTIGFNVPSATTGAHTVSATDGAHTATTTFTVNTGTSLILNTTSGAIASTISASGNGYHATTTILFYFNNALLATNPGVVNSNGTGSFSGVTFTVPALPLGSYIVKANDTFGNSANVTFTINAFAGQGPDAVLDLTQTNVTSSTVSLSWSQPDLHGGSLIGYQINYTTPYGSPLSILVFNTGTSTSNYMVTSLLANTEYSFRVGVFTNHGQNMSGNILNVLTLGGFTPQNFTVGKIDLNGTNPIQPDIRFVRTDITGTTRTNLDVIYLNAMNLTCNFNYEFAATNKTYSNLARVVYDGAHVKSTFQFNNTNNDVIDVTCIDSVTREVGKYVLTQSISSLPIVQQVHDFRAGKWGTQGYFGALDFITLIVVVMSMIGLNRVNDFVGIFFNIAFIGALAFFTIITWPTVVTAALVMVIIFGVTSMRRTQGFP